MSTHPLRRRRGKGYCRQAKDHFQHSRHIRGKSLPLKLPRLLAVRLYEAMLFEFGRTLTRESVARVFNSIRDRKLLDYNRDNAAFCYLYYAANFAKAYLVTQKVLHKESPKSCSIVDVGGGSGAALAAAMVVAKTLNIEVTSVTILDKSAAQLNLFDRITKRWINEAFPSAIVEVVQGDAARYFEELNTGKDTIVLSSYFGCEQSLPWKEYEDALDSVALKSIVIAIDQLTNRRGTYYRANGCKWERLDTEGLEVFAGNICHLPLTIKPKFCSNHNVQPDAGSLPRIVREYFECWQNHSLRRLRELFLPHSRYIIRRIDGERTSLVGIDQITNYWLTNSTKQTNVCWSVNRATVTEHRSGVAFPWQARFKRTDKGEDYELSGRMKFRLEGQRIALLEEDYHVESRQSQTKSSNKVY